MPERYRYALRNRPPSIGALPRGYLWDSHQPHPDFPFGSVEYERPLSPQEIDGFELVDVAEWEARKQFNTGIADRIRRAQSLEEIRNIERDYYRRNRVGFPNDLARLVFKQVEKIDQQEASKSTPPPPPPTFREVTTKRGGRQLTFLNPASQLPILAFAALILFGIVERGKHEP